MSTLVSLPNVSISAAPCAPCPPPPSKISVGGVA